MRRWKRNAWLAAAFVATLLLAGSATAEVVAARGELIAAGNGFAVLDLRGVATLRGLGLVIVERDAIVDTEGHGHVTPLGGGRVLFEGFGRVTVRSFDERTRIEAGGARLRLRARGIGVAFLKGVGHFTTDDQDGNWGADLAVEFESLD
jgi:hypothetical protein